MPDDISLDDVPTQVSKHLELHNDGENGEDSETEEDSESVIESDSYGSLMEKSINNAAKMLTDKNGSDEEDSETEEDSNSITESDPGAVKMMEKAIKKVTAECPTWPKEKDTTTPAMAASANTSQGMVMVVVCFRYHQ
ncbi:hypothetical protein AX15_006977 [Amanita polypyramis BW_CC]|nr:hypothetical protein AX15_006977 [Amanita polypyramis BW_CC]